MPAFYDLAFEFHNCKIFLFVDQFASVFETVFAWVFLLSSSRMEQPIIFFVVNVFYVSCKKSVKWILPVQMEKWNNNYFAKPKENKEKLSFRTK